MEKEKDEIDWLMSEREKSNIWGLMWVNRASELLRWIMQLTFSLSL